MLSPALCASYVDHLVGPDGDEDELLEAHIALASLGRVPEIAQAVEAEADALARDWLTQTRVARKGLTDERQAEYDGLESMSTTPEPISLTTPKNGQADTKVRHPDGTEEDLPTREMHLLASADGTVPITLNEWERKVSPYPYRVHLFEPRSGRVYSRGGSVSLQDMRCLRRRRGRTPGPTAPVEAERPPTHRVGGRTRA